MPMILKGSPLIWIVSPNGTISLPIFSGPPKRASRTPVPMTQTLSAILSSMALNIRPCPMLCPLTLRAPGQVPRILFGCARFPCLVTVGRTSNPRLSYKLTVGMISLSIGAAC